MEATILLCDSAEAINGKLYILGGGWSVMGPLPAPSALAIRLEVPWTDSNKRIPVLVELLTEDGTPVTVNDPLENPQPVLAALDIEVGRPPGVKPGTPLDATVTFGVPPLPLTPGSRYAWRLTINGEHKEHWQAGFSTRELPPGITMPPTA